MLPVCRECRSGSFHDLLPETAQPGLVRTVYGHTHHVNCCAEVCWQCHIFGQFVRYRLGHVDARFPALFNHVAHDINYPLTLRHLFALSAKNAACQ